MKGRLDGCLLGTCIAGFAGESSGHTSGAGQEMVSTNRRRFLHHLGPP
jgi:hypothetical protein